MLRQIAPIYGLRPRLSVGLRLSGVPWEAHPTFYERDLNIELVPPFDPTIKLLNDPPAG